MKIDVKLKIADIVIQMHSDFALKQIDREENSGVIFARLKNFFYTGEKEPDISIKVEIIKTLPSVLNARPLFTTYHFQDGSENWRLVKKANTYVYKCPLNDKEQVIFVDEAFKKATAYLLRRDNQDQRWSVTNIIYDFLQVLLINYLARRNSGIFTHSVGIKDLSGKGLLFTGKSGSGKSTTARLWHKHSKATVLNDDRIIIRKAHGKFLIHGSPWHGDFSDYLESRIESAPLERIFFIRHSLKNKLRRILGREAFTMLYPNLFPTFWDKRYLENIVSFCQDLIKNTSCYTLGFANDRGIIDFIRKI